MQTIDELIELRKQSHRKPDEQELRRLPYKNAYVYGRVSSPGQVRDSRESILEIARLLELAIKDGYKTSLDPEDIKTRLDLIRNDSSAEKIWSQGQVTVDVRDLGISGQLDYEDRLGLAELQRKVAEGKVGAVYLTEGVSRLSRDRDRIIPYQLLKLLKEHSVRIRTLEGVWNPAIDRDHDYLADEFEEAIGERKVMGRRMYRRKAQKAARGEFVGEPIPPGFMLPIIGQKPTGEYEYGKMEPYPPHAAVVNRILEEFVRQRGSGLRTIRKLGGLTFPFFPPELKYMERLTSLRTCVRKESGYRITSSLINGLATNIKLTGVWQWGDAELIKDNHQAVVRENLFLEACHMAAYKGKTKGRAANFEPMEWSGLIYCLNHQETRQIRSIASKGRYTCSQGYLQNGEDICLDIAARYINEPLTATVLKQLDLSPLAEEILARMEAESRNKSLEEIQIKREAVGLEREIEKWQALLTSCVDDITGIVDREKEKFYWAKINANRKRLVEIKDRPVYTEKRPIDYPMVKAFLNGISDKWQSYSLTLRNRLLKLIVDKVEIRGQYEIEAAIYWKNGFVQKVLIHRPLSNAKWQRRWRNEEDELLTSMFKSSPEEAILAALSGRNWKAITMRARRLNLRRDRTIRRGSSWSREDDKRLEICLNAEMTHEEIAHEIGRNVVSVTGRIHRKGIGGSRSDTTRKRRVDWETSNLSPSQESSSRGG